MAELSEREVLGRSLRMEEARAVTEMARRIAAIILPGRKLEANYQAIKENAYKWPPGERGCRRVVKGLASRLSAAENRAEFTATAFARIDRK